MIKIFATTILLLGSIPVDIAGFRRKWAFKANSFKAESKSKSDNIRH
ncbi:MAG: hypothetical protein ISS61_12915 [Desulfobacteraceae bacterium]|nr:hypothetical protein [Desulfobacteraceae bacterium]